MHQQGDPEDVRQRANRYMDPQELQAWERANPNPLNRNLRTPIFHNARPSAISSHIRAPCHPPFRPLPCEEAEPVDVAKEKHLSSEQGRQAKSGRALSPCVTNYPSLVPVPPNGNAVNLSSDGVPARSERSLPPSMVLKSEHGEVSKEREQVELLAKSDVQTKDSILLPPPHLLHMVEWQRRQERRARDEEASTLGISKSTYADLLILRSP